MYLLELNKQVMLLLRIIVTGAGISFLGLGLIGFYFDYKAPHKEKMRLSMITFWFGVIFTLSGIFYFR